MVVKNKKKFIRGIILVLLMVIGLIMLMTSTTFSHQDIKYKKVSVVYGDTLWDIAKDEQETNSYYKDIDVRDIMSDIKDINKLDSSSLVAGQVLVIPE